MFQEILQTHVYNVQKLVSDILWIAYAVKTQILILNYVILISKYMH